MTTLKELLAKALEEDVSGTHASLVASFSILKRIMALPEAVLRDEIQAAREEGQLLLHIAASCGFPLAAIARLLEADPDIDALDDLGNTAVMQAAYHGHGEVVKYLANRRAKTEVYGKQQLEATLKK
jgi:hypothetical protein